VPNLADIESEIQNILNHFAEDVDDLNELDNDVKEYLKDLLYQEQTKIDGIGHVIRKKQNEINFLKEEEQRFKQKRNAIDRSIERLKNYIYEVMVDNEKTQLKGAATTIYLRSSESVIIEDEDALPSEFVEIRTSKHPQKDKIKAAIKEGNVVDGAVLKTTTRAVLR